MGFFKKEIFRGVFRILLNITAIHSVVFTGHLVYACVVVALIFSNDNSLIMTRELTSIN